MFNVGLGEVIVIAVLGLLIFGPDRLPSAVARGAAGLRQLRTLASQAGRELREASGVDDQATASVVSDLKDLHPRRIAASVLEPINDATRDIGSGKGSARPAASGTPAAAGKPAAGAGTAADDDSGDIDPTFV